MHGRTKEGFEGNTKIRQVVTSNNGENDVWGCVEEERKVLMMCTHTTQMKIRTDEMR